MAISASTGEPLQLPVPDAERGDDGPFLLDLQQARLHASTGSSSSMKSAACLPMTCDGSSAPSSFSAGPVDENDAAVVLHVDGVGRELHQAAVPFLALPQGPLRLAARAYHLVEARGKVAHLVPGFHEHRFDREPHAQGLHLFGQDSRGDAITLRMAR